MESNGVSQNGMGWGGAIGTRVETVGTHVTGTGSGEGRGKTEHNERGRHGAGDEEQTSWGAARDLTLVRSEIGRGTANTPCRPMRAASLARAATRETPGAERGVRGSAVHAVTAIDRPVERSDRVDRPTDEPTSQAVRSSKPTYNGPTSHSRRNIHHGQGTTLIG